ncbi:MAG: RecQ family ATP-dependent DNA helicase [Ginsengibacter sp.]
MKTKSAEVLKKFWGYDSFRSLQQEIIDSVLAKNDTLAVMPTGGGKSICFQIPSLLNEGLCLVISPLIALMKDQLLNLKKKGIPALSICSGMTFIEVKKTLQNAAYGNFKFLYVSPERLETELFLEYLPLIKLNLIAVDEAHCISQWGYDFRPAYLRIALIREYFPEVPILALTASATMEVQKDICEKLLFKKNQKKFQQSFARPNLSYSAFELSSKQNKLLEIVKKVSGSGIVYCKTRRRTKEIAEILNLNGINSDFYHAGLTSEERTKKQEDWIANKTRIIACTNAFGMGIDKPDVRTVVHYDVPDSLENYYQEAGRAGRDGKKSYAVLLYNSFELEELKKQLDKKFPSNEMIKKVYGDVCNFLQLPAGSGETNSYDFDINTFVKNFKLDAIVVNSVLKILEQEELITYSEQFFQLPTVVFTIDKNALNDFEKSHPQYSEVIKGLLRSYDGIFDFPSAINETQLAKFIVIKKEKLMQNLNELKSLGIIDYSPQKEKPQIYFLKNRVRSSDLFINQKNILKRKEAFEKRLNAMIDFCNNKSSCRSVMIGRYFNDENLDSCGICDNCLRSEKLNISTEEFNFISSEIKKICFEQPVSKTNLLRKLPTVKENKISKILTFLQEENLITVNHEGLIRVK